MFSPSENPYEMRKHALVLYRRQEWRGQLARFLAWLQRKPARLENLGLGEQDETRHQHYTGLHAVAIEVIAGTEEQAPGFDRGFFPLHEHTMQNWLSLAEARLSGKTLPPVQLIQVGDNYYVRDGHHRISVAKALDEAFIDAEIVRWQVR